MGPPSDVNVGLYPITKPHELVRYIYHKPENSTTFLRQLNAIERGPHPVGYVVFNHCLVLRGLHFIQCSALIRGGYLLDLMSQSQYPLVIYYSHGKSPFFIGKPSINRPFPMATWNNQKVNLALSLHMSSLNTGYPPNFIFGLQSPLLLLSYHSCFIRFF